MPNSDFIKLAVSNMLPPAPSATPERQPKTQRKNWRLVGAFSVMAAVLTTIQAMLPPQPLLVAALLGLGAGASVALSYFLFREDFTQP